MSTRPVNRSFFAIGSRTHGLKSLVRPQGPRPFGSTYYWKQHALRFKGKGDQSREILVRHDSGRVYLSLCGSSGHRRGSEGPAAVPGIERLLEPEAGGGDAEHR